MMETQKVPSLVWVAKERKEAKKQKRVSFVNPIATVLRAPKYNTPDDSILLIKDQYTVMVDDEEQLVEPANPTVTLNSPSEMDNSYLHADHGLLLPVSVPNLMLADHVVPAAGGNGDGSKEGTQGDNTNKLVELLMEQLHNFLVYPQNPSLPSPMSILDTLASEVVQKTLPTAVEQIVTPQDSFLLEANELQLSPIPIDGEVIRETLAEQTHQKSVPTQESEGLSQTPLPPIDHFIESISSPLIQPLLRQANIDNIFSVQDSTFQTTNPSPSSNKRQSTRLAKKAQANVGKDALQVAQELLVKN